MTSRFRRSLFLSCAVLLASSMPIDACAQSTPPLLSPDQAFGLTYADVGRTVQLQFHVAPGYRLYRDRVRVFDDASKRATLSVMLPPGKISYNAALGETVETYDQDFAADVSIPPTRPLRIVVRIQGCADVGVCYPPVERAITLTGR